MAHTILYEPGYVIFPSDLDDLQIQVDGPYVDVMLSRPEGNSMVTVFQERFYAYNGLVTLRDLGSLVEVEMRSAGLSFSFFNFRAYTDTPSNNYVIRTFRIIFCDRVPVCADAWAFARENFLTTLAYRRVAPCSSLCLSLFASKAESLAYSIRYLCQRADGTTFSHSLTRDTDKIATSMCAVEIVIDTSSILVDAASFAETSPADLRLLTFSVICGQRSVTCHVDPELNDKDSFFFRNCFNALECACLPVTTTTKTDVNRSTAVINGKSNFYDGTTEKQHEVQAGPLTSNEADWIDQLITSYEVMRMRQNAGEDAAPYTLLPVIITDCSCEMSDSDEKPNSLKFTWRYSDARPHVKLPASPGIFTQQFDFRFS